jgi:pimeloyl-ACP methyl ester carboxylesterase
MNAGNKATIVLVHGAFADGNSWAKVIPLLEAYGYTAVAVQIPLISFANDVETAKRVLDAQQGPVVAAAHSYGGAVITAAASGNANVKALVYVAAAAPDANEKVSELLGRFGPSLLGSALVPDAAGFLYIERSKFAAVFAGDVTQRQWRVMAATQKPIHATAFGAALENPAWKAIPSWYAVATDDHAITPEVQRFMAQRIGAKTFEVKSSHAMLVSKPDAVAALIKEAAIAAQRNAETESAAAQPRAA